MFLLIGTVGFSLYNVYLLSQKVEQRNALLSNNIAVVEPGEAVDNNAVVAQAKTKIDLLKIVDSDCSECFSTDNLIGIMKQRSANSEFSEKTIEFDSVEGKELVKKFSLKKIPTIVLQGDVNKAGLIELFRGVSTVEQNAVVLRKILPPYLDLDSGKVVGKVSVTLIEKKDCAQCFDANLLVNELKSLNVFLTDEKRLFFDDNTAKELIQKYNIARLPVLVLSSDLNYYEDLVAGWANVGSVESDGVFLTRNIVAPFFDANSLSVKGLVNGTFLFDSNCSTCSDVNQLKDSFLEQLKIGFSETSFVDKNSVEGKELMKKFSIKKLPTVIFSQDFNYYQFTLNNWALIGSAETIDNNTFFVSRNLDLMGVQSIDVNESN